MKRSLPTLFLLSALMLTACSSTEKDYDASGTFEATEVVVSAQTQGQLLQMMPEEGDTVKLGQCLAQVDTVQLSLRRRQLLASLSALGSRHYDVGRQVATVRQQIATQQRERRRYAQLVNDRAAGTKTLDDIDAQIALLNRQLAAQEEVLAKTNRSLTDEQRGVEAQIAQIDDQIRRARITAPISGVILAKYAERGELAAPSRQLYRVADLSEVYLRAYVTAPQLTRLRLGQPVTVYADRGEKDRKAYRGKLTWIASEAEFTPKTIQTRDERANLVYAVKIRVKNDGLIKLGMYGECKF